MCMCARICVCVCVPPTSTPTHCAPTLLLQLHSVTASSPPHCRCHWDKSQCHHASRLNTAPLLLKPPLTLFFSLLLCTLHPHPAPQSAPIHLPSFCSCPLSYCYKTNLSSDSIIHWAGPEEAAQDGQTSSADLRRGPGWLFPHVTPASIQPRASRKKKRGDSEGFKPVAPVYA